MTSQSGGGATFLPGVTSSGGDGVDVPGSLIVNTVIRDTFTDRGDSGSDAIRGRQGGPLGADNQAAALSGVRVGATNGHSYTEAVIYAEDDSNSPLTALLYQGYSSLGSVYKVNNAGGVGLFGHDAPTAPRTLAQSVITAITDANAKTAVQALADTLADMGVLTIT